MSSAESSTSPRGVPPIRPDWLVDVAWRLADVGLDRMRAAPEEARFTVEDLVDGAMWRFDSLQLSEPWATSIEHDADLYLPTDDGGATFRAGFQFTPWWDEAHGRCIQARVEIGPRGPVTFDPENWFVLLPLPGASRPSIEGVHGGAWAVHGDGPVEPAPAEADDLVGLSVTLSDVARLAKPDASIPELTLAAQRLERRRGLLGRSKVRPSGPPVAVARLVADRGIDVAWTGDISLDEAVDRPGFLVDRVDSEAGQVTFRGLSGVLTLTGPGLDLSVVRPISET